MTSNITRRMARVALPLLACALLCSCASLIGQRQLELPLAKLQQGLERRFPLENRMMALLHVELTRPRLALLPDDRIGLALEAKIAPPFTKQSWRGGMAMSGRLLLDASRNAVFLREARVDQFTVDGVDAGVQRQLAKAANLVAQQIAGEVPLYNFRPEELRYAGVQFVPTGIRTTAAALIVTFEAAK
ncbi:hypothetical protein ACFDR9_005320 [Janthinobacterium sp. CG_23.3]|uniref:DUF1439 domain-containing protein n=1 Tax=Janthinobacterium sp. CG_23.3 TaxID=3349634 RepID=UPI0038D4547A